MGSYLIVGVYIAVHFLLLNLGFGGSLFLWLALLGFRGVCLIGSFLLRRRLVLSLKCEGNLGLQICHLLQLLLLSTCSQVCYRETARLSVKFRQKILSTRSAFTIQGSEGCLAFVAAALGALHLPCHEGSGLGFGLHCSASVRLLDNLSLQVVLRLRTVWSLALMSTVICLECTVLMHHLCRGVVRELELIVVHLDVAVKALPVLGLSSVHHGYVGSEVVAMLGGDLLVAVMLMVVVVLLGVLAHFKE